MVGDSEDGGVGPADAATKRDLDRVAELLAGGEAGAAAKLAQRLVEREPRLTRAQVLLGRALTMDARRQSPPPVPTLEAGETALLAATRLEARSAEAWVALGELYEVDGHLEAALAAYRRVLEFAAYDRTALIGASRLATELGQERAAARHLEVLLQVPDCPTEALFWQARCHLVLGRAKVQETATETQRVLDSLERARSAFAEISRRLPDDARGPAGEAFCRFEIAKRRPEAATAAEHERLKDLWLRAARLAPNDPWPRFNLGEFLESDVGGDKEAAIQVYRTNLDRDPDHVPTLLNLARLLWLANRRDEARPVYRRVLPLLTDSSERERVDKLLAGQS